MSNIVLTYGSLRKGFHNHGLLGMSKFLGMTDVPGKMYSLGSFPGVRLDEPGSVKCEVYEVDDLTLKRLDKLEGYRDKMSRTNFYDRLPVRFSLDGESRIGEIYQINEHYTDREVVPSGDWSEYKSSPAV